MIARQDWMRLTLLSLGTALVLTGTPGCVAVNNTPAPGQVLKEQDPDRGRPYRLYVPTSYTPERKWALVVTCHGTVPFDTAAYQFNEWKGLAEDRGFLVVAPELTGTSAVYLSTEQQIRRQMDDERQILSTVRSVRASHAIDDTRIFLTGWSAGGYAVLFTGLRHPEVFRALAVRQGNFKQELFELCSPFIDRYQPILIMFGNIDPLKEDAEKGIAWLKSHDLDPVVVERPGAHRRDPEPVYSFFVDVVRHRPWIRVGVEDSPSDPMRVRFGVRTSFEPVNWIWDFGDGEQSTAEAPAHRYASPGQYQVRVGVYGPGMKNPYVRQLQLQVPRVRLGSASAPAGQGG